MHPILIKLGAITFYSYGFMVSMGFLMGILLSCYLAKKVSIEAEKILDISLFVLIGAIVGARIFYDIFFWHELRNFWEAFYVWNGGLVFYGGLLFAILGVVCGCKLLKINLLDMLDVATPATALGYAIGRIGCFLNGCCYGITANLPFAVSFPNLEGLRHPTQIYASISGLIMMAVLLYIFYKRKFPGQVFASGIIAYGFYRFFIEYYRALPRVMFNLTEAQLGSIFVFVLGIILYGIFNRRSRR